MATLTEIVQGNIELNEMQKANLSEMLGKYLRGERREAVHSYIMKTPIAKWPKCFWAFDRVILEENNFRYVPLLNKNHELVEVRNHLMGWSR